MGSDQLRIDMEDPSRRGPWPESHRSRAPPTAGQSRHATRPAKKRSGTAVGPAGERPEEGLEDETSPPRVEGSEERRAGSGCDNGHRSARILPMNSGACTEPGIYSRLPGSRDRARPEQAPIGGESRSPRTPGDPREQEVPGDSRDVVGITARREFREAPVAWAGRFAGRLEPIRPQGPTKDVHLRFENSGGGIRTPDTRIMIPLL